MATHSSMPAWRIPMDGGAWRATVHGGRKELDTTEHMYTHTPYGTEDKGHFTFQFYYWLAA